MSAPTIAKLVLAAAGLAVFLLGVRVQVDAVRWTGIALVAAAWLLRFVARTPRRGPPSDPPAGDETRS